MASFGRPASAGCDDVPVPSNIGDIPEPLTLSSAQIQMLREQYLRLYGRNGTGTASNGVQNVGPVNPASVHTAGPSNPPAVNPAPVANGTSEPARAAAAAASKN